MMMSSVVIFEMYAASYTAFLAVSKLASPFDSLDDMYENTDYRIGAIVSTPFRDIITGVGLEVCRQRRQGACRQVTRTWPVWWRRDGRRSSPPRRASRGCFREAMAFLIRFRWEVFTNVTGTQLPTNK